MGYCCNYAKHFLKIFGEQPQNVLLNTKTLNLNELA
jgi:hypothetical protein